MKKTKIVCTIGPASQSEEVLKELIENGMNIARLNFSHGNHEEQKERIDTIKRVRETLKKPIGIMLDTKGPEIRTTKLKEDSIILKEGKDVIITTRDILGDENILGVSYKGIVEDINIGDKILIDDGLVELEVIEKINSTDINCRVLNEGEVKDHKGVNLPGVKIKLPAITEKDINDIKFGIDEDVDFIAASFVRKAEDVLNIRKVLEDNGSDDIKIISKIENQEGVDNLEEIIEVSDGIMVARGDLGVEVPTSEIALIQKNMIKKSNEAGKPVITATQMLDSMIRNPRPTRAEVTDVSNAILDGTDAIMLSGETAAGKYPVESVRTMREIALEIEKSIDFRAQIRNKDFNNNNVTDAISYATCTTAMDLNAEAIITATSSGHTARMVSKFRPSSFIIAATTREKVRRKLELSWGVYSILTEQLNSTDDIINNSVFHSLKNEYIESGDLVVITAGVPVGVAGTTNLIKVHVASDILLSGQGIGKGTITGRVNIIDENTSVDDFEEGGILVARYTDRTSIDLIEKASAIIVEEGGLTCHAAIVALNLNKTAIVGVNDATEILKTNDLITVDGSTGLIYKGKSKVL